MAPVPIHRPGIKASDLIRGMPPRNLNKMLKNPYFPRLLKKAPDARRSAKGGAPTEGGSRRTPGTPQ